MKSLVTRRDILRMFGVGSLGLALSACQPKVVEKIVKETVVVEKVVKEVVKETVLVAGTPQVVEKEIEKVVTTTPGLAAKKVTLNIWDQWAGGGADAGMELMLARYKNKHPHVEFEREVYGGMELRDIVKTAIGAGTGPDIVYIDIGAFGMGQLVRAGQLLSLDDAYQHYGWDKKIFPIGQTLASIDGKRYAVPHEFEYEPVFYNKAVYEKLGLGIPKTHADFVANCEACKKAGYIPIAAGNAGNPAVRHIWGFPLNNLMGKKKMDDVFLCGASWDQPKVVESIKITGVDYVQYYPPDSLAVKGQDANNMYYAGQAIHMMYGTWMVSSIIEAESDFETGIYLYPSIDGGEVLPQSGFGSGYMVTKSCVAPEVAFDVLDYLFSDESAKVWLETISVVPPMPIDASAMNLPQLFKDVLAVFSQPGIQFGWMVPTYVPPAFYETMRAGLQQIIAGEKTPKEQAADLQKLWQAAIDEGIYTLRC